MTKIIALAFSDLHIHKFKAFNVNNSRLINTLNAWGQIGNKARIIGVPVLFGGDLFHNPKEVENETMAMAQKYFNTYFEKHDVLFCAISGNHDMSERNSTEHKSPSHLQSFDHFPHFLNLDYTSWETKDFVVHGIPFMNSDYELAGQIKNIKPNKGKFNILLLHTDIPGAKNAAGFECKETDNIPRNLNKFFRKWDLVLCGHIHSPQKLADNVYMLGSPIHQNQGDTNEGMGYWEVYSNGKMVKKVMDFPKFINLGKGEVAKNDHHYYIPYDKMLADNEVEKGEFNINLSREKLATRYVALKNIKSESKRNALIKILNEVE